MKARFVGAPMLALGLVVAGVPFAMSQQAGPATGVAPLIHSHAGGAQLSNDIQTPGSPNQYYGNHDRGLDASDSE